jgi:hypothetical protein
LDGIKLALGSNAELDHPGKGPELDWHRRKLARTTGPALLSGMEETRTEPALGTGNKTVLQMHD